MNKIIALLLHLNYRNFLNYNIVFWKIIFLKFSFNFLFLIENIPIWVRLAEWLPSMPSNKASEGSSLTRCKYLTGYNLIPFRGRQWETTPVRNFPREITMERILSTVIAHNRNRIWHLKNNWKYTIAFIDWLNL